MEDVRDFDFAPEKHFFAAESHSKMSRCSKICNIVMLVLLLGTISAKLPSVPVNRKSLMG